MLPGNEIYGLVICGGQSSRMGTDKSLLNYHGLPQRYYIYNMLQNIFGRALISCNGLQAKTMMEGYDSVVDAEEYANIGPMAGLLSAYQRYPDATFIVVGCDYPFMRKEDIQRLWDFKQSDCIAATYYNEKERLREPLLGIYKSGCGDLLLEQFLKQDFSLRHFLNDNHAEKVIPTAPHLIQSIDTSEGFQTTLEQLEDKNN